MKLRLLGETVIISVGNGYRNAPNQPSIRAVTLDQEPYAVLTKFIPDILLNEDETVLDTNNIGNAAELLVSAGIVENTDRTCQSGFSTYPIVKVIKKGDNERPNQ